MNILLEWILVKVLSVSRYLDVLSVGRHLGVHSVSRHLGGLHPVLPAKCVSTCWRAKLGLHTTSLAKHACRMHTWHHIITPHAPMRPVMTLVPRRTHRPLCSTAFHAFTLGPLCSTAFHAWTHGPLCARWPSCGHIGACMHQHILTDTYAWVIPDGLPNWT